MQVLDAEQLEVDKQLSILERRLKDLNSFFLDLKKKNIFVLF